MIFLVVFLVMFLVFMAMAIGVIFANKPISGSCGGMKALGMDVSCEICGGDQSKCDSANEMKAIDREVFSQNGAFAEDHREQGAAKPSYYDGSDTSKKF